MILDVAKVMSSLGNGTAKSSLQPGRFLRGELWKFFTYMSDVKLVAESISGPAKCFSEEIGGCCRTDKAGSSEETCNASPELLEKFGFFVLIFHIVMVR